MKFPFGRWMADPWGQLVIYLVIFAILGWGVLAFFNWARGPVRSRYTPFHEPAPSAPAPRP